MTVSPPQAYPVEVEDAYGNVLNLGEGDYRCETFGLHDYPTVAPILTSGNADGAYLVDTNYVPRQFSMNVHIEAGRGKRIIRNDEFNAARDALIRMFRRGTLLRVRTVYLGYDDPFEIEAIVQAAPWQVGTRTFAVSLLAPDPTLRNTLVHTEQAFLPDEGEPEKTFTVHVGGNVEAKPTVLIIATAAKLDRWNYLQKYTVENPVNVSVQGYPVMIPFDLGAAITAGKVNADTSDLRVKANGVFVDRWFAGPAATADRIWVALDIEGFGTASVEVIYGAPLAPPWNNTTKGPIFRLDQSTNVLRHYEGAFADPPGNATSLLEQWNVHYSVATGMQSIVRHLPGPWSAGDGTRVNAAGGEIPVSAQIQGYAGRALHHPLGIVSMEFSGWTQLDPLKAKLVVRARNESDGSLEDVWVYSVDTQSALTAFGPITLDFTGTEREAVVLALRSLTSHTETAPRIGGADYVRIEIANPLVVTADGPETGTYMLEFTLENQTTGQALTLFGTLSGNTPPFGTVLLNMRTHDITVEGEPFYYALLLAEPIREDWFSLVPGDNVIRVREEGVTGMEVDIMWQDTRM